MTNNRKQSRVISTQSGFLMWLMVLLISTLSMACSSVEGANSVVIVNVTVIDVRTGVKEAKDIFIKGSRITSIQPHGTLDSTYIKHL